MKRSTANPIGSIALLFLCLVSISALQADPTLHIDASQVTAQVSPTLYGLMTEEINHSYDGGLYAELIQNRTFQDNGKDPVHWNLIQSGSNASMALDPGQPLNDALKTSLKLDASGAALGNRVGIANDGWWGIPVKSDTTYRVSFYAKGDSPSSGPLTVSIESNDGTKTFAKVEIPQITSEWKQYTASLKTERDASVSSANRFVISTESQGTIWFNLVSLFPPTYKDRPNGNRIDLMQMLVDMKPGFLRFPGGCYLEGMNTADHFDWKKMIGPLTERPTHFDSAWHYRSSDGMGLLEFFEWAEDMKAEPVLAVYAGHSPPWPPRPGYKPIPAGSGLQPFVDEALDEIEYVTGDASTKWGARRVADGHPEPFPLTYVEIGNEDFNDDSLSYDGRFAQFYDAIKAKYPNLKLISTIGDASDFYGQKSPWTSRKVHSRTPDVIDEHYYWSAEDFEKMAPTYFDKYDRKGPKLFIGEWATKSGALTPDMKCAMADAALMTAMERNSDLIIMHCYAPLLTNINPGASQWRPDMIGYDALRSYGSPSYYAFQMFSQHHGDLVLKASLDGAPEGPVPPLHDAVTKDGKTGAIYIKLVNVTGTPQPVNIALQGAAFLAPTGKAVTLSAKRPDETNSIGDPTHLIPVESKIEGVGPTFTYTFPPYSVTVLQLATQ
jgi:alpha-N-arabinofuranosidase